jgi:hypothetical protein
LKGRVESRSHSSGISCSVVWHCHAEKSDTKTNGILSSKIISKIVKISENIWVITMKYYNYVINSMESFDYPKHREYKLHRNVYNKLSINVASWPEGCYLHQKAGRNSVHINEWFLTAFAAVCAPSHKNLIHTHTYLHLSSIFTLSAHLFCSHKSLLNNENWNKA